MERMPVLFVGHGSPMNAIEENEFSRTWATLGAQLSRPTAILSVSAHWYTDGIRVSDVKRPETIHDMYGFPEELYEVVYPAPGAPEFAKIAQNLIGEAAQLDQSWGLDHGTWSVLRWMYSEADIPVFQISVDHTATMETCYQLGRRLKELRKEGVLIVGSGNVVHNLALVDWHNEGGGYPWAEEFDSYIKQAILARRDEDVMHYERAGSSAQNAFVTSDHFAPLLYCLGAAEQKDSITVFNEKCTLGAISMTGYLFAEN